MSARNTADEEKAKRELNETEENRAKGIKYMNHLITSETKLFFPKEDTEFLVRFLRWSKWNYRKAFDRLTTYYNHRKEREEEYERYKPSNLVDLFQQKFQILLPKRDRNGCIKYMNPEQDSMEFIYLFIFCFHRLLDDPETQINGVNIVANYRDFSHRHLTQQVTPSNIYLGTYSLLRCFPIRIKGIHVINAPPLFSTVNAIASPIMPEKIRNRYFVHGNLEDFFKHVDRDVLPVEAGGTLNNLDYEAFAKEMLDWEETHWNRHSRYGNRVN